MGNITSNNIRNAAPNQAIISIESSLLPYDIIEKGDQSGIDEAFTETYRTQDSFSSLWKKHTSNTFPSPDIPNIPFGSSMVLSIFRGMVNTGGYGIEITSVENLEDEIVVSCLKSDPAPWEVTATVLSQPYDMVNVTASDKPVRYIIEESAAPERPFPTFMVLFKDGVDQEAIMEGISSSHDVDSVSLLKSSGIGIVHFDSESISEGDALVYLRDIEGVRLVETDPPQ